MTRLTSIGVWLSAGILPFAALAAVSAFGVPSALAADEEMVIREGVLDEIRLKALGLPKDIGVIVRKFSTDRASLGTAEAGDHEKRVEAATMMKREAPLLFAKTMVDSLSLGGTFLFAKESEEAPPENAIVVEGRFTLINPGSRAKRWAAGFGAGKSQIEVEGTVKNSKGDLLAEFRHRRVSGFGVGGGDYVKFLSDDTKDCARDTAIFLKRWATGGDLKKEAD